MQVLEFQGVSRAVSGGTVWFGGRCVAIENVKVVTLLGFSSRGWSKRFEKKKLKPEGHQDLKLSRPKGPRKKTRVALETYGVGE